MGPPTEPTLLEGTPEEGARRIALAQLDQVQRAAERWMNARDEEALHDVRVALRRLRTTMRIWREALRGSVRRRDRRRLGELARRTGPARDAEAQLAWFEEAGRKLPPAARAAAARFCEILRERQKDENERLRRTVAPAILALLPGLRRRLSRYAIERHVGVVEPPSRFGAQAAERVLAQANALRQALRSVRSANDDARAHESRIEAKRLRYLLEPLVDDVREAEALVRVLRPLQDLLGEMQDLAVLTRALRAESEEETRGAQRAGLRALLQAIETRRRALFRELARRWLAEPSALDDLVAAAGSLARRLGQLPHGGSFEIERKFLLDAVPPRARDVAPIEIDQGYLPGRDLHERLRRVRRGAEERFLRCVKVGRGVRRLEIEEETTRAVFEAMWPLTEGKRVRKRRYEVEEGLHVFEIDEFLDRDLVLCEVELADERDEVRLPPWLAPHVVREVTNDARYLNLSLAR